jgi:hypothetical protein
VNLWDTAGYALAQLLIIRFAKGVRMPRKTLFCEVCNTQTSHELTDLKFGPEARALRCEGCGHVVVLPKGEVPVHLAVDPAKAH